MGPQHAWKSPNYRDGAFHNLSPTEMLSKDASIFKVIAGFFSKPNNTAPDRPLPFVKTDLQTLPAGPPVLIWFGHSSYLIHYNGLNILTDPVFSGHASPIPGMIKAFAGTNNYSAADMPDIDILLITHNHYDHLDKATLRQLAPRVKAVYTALGVGRDLVRAGIPAAIITEMDWWDTTLATPDLALTAAPARHFSGRGLRRNHSLWTSFILQWPGYCIYAGGDSGYDAHFKTIGEKFGPFDLAILETGQYNENWPQIHMFPEEAVQAAVDLGARVLLPVHWGKFALARHPWKEPVERTLRRAGELRVRVTTPRIGDPVIPDTTYPDTHWWEF